MKICPFCAEEIQEDALKCKHCGSWVDGQEEKKKKLDEKKEKEEKANEKIASGGGIGCLVIIVIFVLMFKFCDLNDTTSIPDPNIKSSNHSASTKYVHVNSNIRQSASKDSKIIKTLKSGSQVTVGELEGNWYQVVNVKGSLVGYIHKSLVKVNPMPKPSKRKHWFEGGTLHRSTAGEWHSASYSNRLATSGDFVANATGSKDLEEIKIMAVGLEACITAATDDPRLYGQEVSSIGVLCLIQLGYVSK